MDDHNRFVIDAEFSPVPLLLVAADGVIEKSNRRLDELFGYERGELHGQQLEILVPRNVRRYHEELRNAFFEIPTSRQMGAGRDLFGVHKDGSLVPVEIGLDHLTMNHRPMVLATVLDIRERKSREAFISRALNAASSAMIQVNEKGIIELTNHRAGTMFRYQPDQLLGMSIELLVPERYRRKHPVYRTGYLSDHSSRGMGVGRDLYGLRSDGSEFPVEITLTPIHLPGGHSTMATVLDITDRKAREDRIRDSHAQLKQLNEELAQFAYSASHDLKSPLTSVLGLLHLCQVDIESDALHEVRHNLDKCVDLVQLLADRIENTLQLAQADSVAAEWTELDVESHLPSIWADLRPASVRLETQWGHSKPVHTVPARFTTIVENLLSNAIKFRDTGQSAPFVRVITEQMPGEFRLKVVDNGIGIAAEHFDRVFKPFERVAESMIAGSGLGLAISLKNAQQLDGTLEVKCENGVTIFTLTLPQPETSFQ
ncbi:sensor histidine kinase [Roseiconus lacunae]|uniref:sensor histidine kinase n=1 Tax=Roseiconus lacunae TaxID=2605694 RepID=UPI0011F34F4D|nr:PAS domain-containing sensor histidine kinase [Roseiconus lacunae]